MALFNLNNCVFIKPDCRLNYLTLTSLFIYPSFNLYVAKYKDRYNNTYLIQINRRVATFSKYKQYRYICYLETHVSILLLLL